MHQFILDFFYHANLKLIFHDHGRTERYICDQLSLSILVLPFLSFTSAKSISQMKAFLSFDWAMGGRSRQIAQTKQNNTNHYSFFSFFTHAPFHPQVIPVQAPCNKRRNCWHLAENPPEIDNASGSRNRLTNWRGGPRKHTLTWNSYLNNTCHWFPHHKLAPSDPAIGPVCIIPPAKIPPPGAQANTFDQATRPDGLSDYEYNLWPQESQSISQQQLEGEVAISLIGCVINTLV